MEFNIPSNRIEGFKLFVSLADDVRANFIKELISYPVGQMPETFYKDLADKVKIPVNHTSEILDTLTSLVSAKDFSDVTLDVFIEGIIKALEKEKIKGITPSFKKNLFNILNSDNKFYTTIKAKDLINENENILLSTRIITDIRPIFSDNDTCKLTGSMILHNLRVRYYKEAESSVIYFTLNEKDINQLITQLNRAKEKESIIRKEYRPSPLSFQEKD